MDRGTMTVKELQQFLNIGRVTAYELCASKGFPSIRIGRRVLVSRQGLEKWLEAKEGEGNGHDQ